ncbi:MAG: PorT family protein, partial [Porphyromonadaceae bacterium]|nr:PorT family protein [Porphyromonadaceae bacterium]
MKPLYRIAFLLLLSLSFPTQSQAQRKYNDYRSVSVGVKGGVTFSRVNFRPSVHENYLMGMTVGASVRYIEEKYFGIIGEVSYSQFGWKEDFSKQTPNTYEFSHTLNYVTAAILSHIFFGNEPVRGFINMGPQIGLYISDDYTSNFDINQLPNFSSSWETQQYYEPLKTKFDYGITAGVGFEL